MPMGDYVNGVYSRESRAPCASFLAHRFRAEMFTNYKYKCIISFLLKSISHNVFYLLFEVWASKNHEHLDCLFGIFYV